MKKIFLGLLLAVVLLSAKAQTNEKNGCYGQNRIMQKELCRLVRR